MSYNDVMFCVEQDIILYKFLFVEEEGGRIYIDSLSLNIEFFFKSLKTICYVVEKRF